MGGVNVGMNRQILLYNNGGERSDHKVKGHQNLAKYYNFKALCELGRSLNLAEMAGF